MVSIGPRLIIGPMLDKAEFDRWWQAAADEESVARALVEAEAFNAVVLHVEQAVELLLKGLLRGVGAAKEAWGHGLADLGSRARDVAGLKLPDDLAHELAVLERDYKPTRYPDALVSGTPRANYDHSDAIRSLDTLDRVRAEVQRCWDHLRTVDAEAQDDDRGRI